jgi:DNA-binding transcriptional MerR regulator
MDVQVWMASKEVADRLDVHVRTLRNWLDMFVPAQERQKNPQGHYLISEKGFSLLKEVKERKENGSGSLRDIQRQMCEEGLLPEEMLLPEELLFDETAVSASETTAVQSGIQEMEMSVQEALVQFQHQLTQLASLHQTQTTILQKITDMEERQETLRLELRRVTFEMDLMQQRLTKRKERYARYQSRWSLNPFRWFTRSEQAAEQ